MLIGMSRSMRLLLLQRSFSDHIRSSTSKALDRLSKPARESRLAEIEAKEACTWLRAAGFPQYAQLYEDGLFPIDISSVTRDHDFLDRDAIEALCRRLNTLNKCALMRLEISPQRKRESTEKSRGVKEVICLSDSSALVGRPPPHPDSLGMH